MSDDPEIARWEFAAASNTANEELNRTRNAYSEAMARLAYEKTHYPFEIEGYKKLVLKAFDKGRLLSALV